LSVSQYRTKAGVTVRLGSRLGEGGEGTVLDVTGAADLAAKIYKPGLASEREGKVVAMVDARLHTNKFVAYPIDALFDMRTNAFVGFTMRKARDRKPVHELYSPSSRKTAFRLLLFRCWCAARALGVPVSVFFEEGNNAAAREKTEAFGYLLAPGAVDLLKAFITIEDDQLRREVLALVRSAARMEQDQGA
jgi:DNA-binding helix-hairpin-helix protein with protein kinase domain